MPSMGLEFSLAPAEPPVAEPLKKPEFNVARSVLFKALGHCQSIIERKATIPILQNILITTGEGNLRLTATDMDTVFEEVIPAEIMAPGAVTVPAHLFFDIVSKIPSDSTIKLFRQIDTTRVSVRAGRSRFHLPYLPVEDFPPTGRTAYTASFSLNSDVLRKLIDQTHFAISNQGRQHYLSGIYFHTLEIDGQNFLRSVATDGHRLARYQVPSPSDSPIPSVIIPRKTVYELRKLLDNEEPVSVLVELSPTRARFSFESILLTSKLVDGSFPEYERVIPTNLDKTIALDRRVFEQVVDRVSTVGDEEVHAVKLLLQDGLLILSASAASTGHAKDEIAVDYVGQSVDISFNARFLLDAAQQISGENLHFSFKDPSAPAIVTDPDDDNSLFVLMPMHV